MARSINTSFEFADVADLDAFGSRSGPEGVFLDDTVTRTGSKSLKIVSAATANYFRYDCPDDTLAAFIVAIRLTAVPAANLTILQAIGASRNFNFFVNTSGSLVLQVVGGTAVNSGINVTDGNWHLVRVKLNTSTATYRAVWGVDGVNQTDATSTGTAAQAVTDLRIGNPTAASTGTIWYDDFAWDSDDTQHPLVDTSADATDALTAVATADATLSAAEAWFADTVTATATATATLSAADARFVDTVTATATASAILSVEQYDPAVIVPYDELVSATATASASLSDERFWITETLVAAAIAPPMLAAEEFRATGIVTASATGGASLANEQYIPVGVYSDLVVATATATATLPVQDVCQVIEATEDAAAIINAAAAGAKFDLAEGRHALTATIRPKANQKILGRGPASQLDRAQRLTGWRSLGGGKWEYTGTLPAALQVENFTVSLKNEQSIWANTLYKDSVPLWKVGVRTGSVLYGQDETAVAAGQCFIDFDASRIVVGAATALDLGNVLAISTPGDIISTSADSVTVEQLYLFGGCQRGIRALGPNVKIRFNEIRGCTVLATFNDFADVSYNKLLYGGQYCYTSGGSSASPILGWKFHHNEVAYGDFLDMQRPTGSMWGNGACKFTHTRNCEVTDNWFHDNTMGVWGDISNKDGLIARNTIERCGKHGIHWEISFACTIEDNIISECERCIYISTSQDTLTRRNTLYAGGPFAVHVNDATRGEPTDFGPLRGINNIVRDNLVFFLNSSAQMVVNSAAADNLAWTTNQFIANAYVSQTLTAQHFAHQGNKTFTQWKAAVPGGDAGGVIGTTPPGPDVPTTTIYPDLVVANAVGSAQAFDQAGYQETVQASAVTTAFICRESVPIVFGRSTPGTASNWVCETDHAYVTDYDLALTGDGALRRMWVWVDGRGPAASGIASLRGVIYDDASKPANLVAYSTNQIDVRREDNLAGFWAAFDFTGEEVRLTGRKYWLGIHVGGVTNVVRLPRDARAAAFRISLDTYADGAAALFTQQAQGGYEISTYAEVEVQTSIGFSYTELVQASATAGAQLAGDEVVVGGSSSGWVGVGSRVAGSSTDITAFMNSNPSFKISGGMIYWNVLEPTPNTYRWGDTDASGTKLAEAQWSGIMRSFKGARDSRAQTDGGWKFILRISCGVDAPDWLKTTRKPKKAGETGFPGNRALVEFMDTIGTDVQRVPISFPVPWDPNLLLAYQDLITEVDRKMRESDGAGGTWGDHVYYVPICLPTEQGTEMTMGFGQAEKNTDGTYADEAWWPGPGKTGVYKGVTYTGKWRIFTRINEDEWIRVSNANTGWTPTTPPPAQTSAYTSAQQSAGQTRNQADLGQAWINATRVHAETLGTVPSGVAFGTLFGDGNAGGNDVLDDCIARGYQNKIWLQSTDLRSGSTAPYRYAQFSFSRHQLFLRGKAAGFVIGFQTAGSSFFGASADQKLPVNAGEQWSGRSKFEWALEDGRDTYGALWIETVPTQSFINLHQPYYTNYQRTLGGSIPGGTNIIETVVAGATGTAILSNEVFSGVATAYYDIVAAAASGTAIVVSEINSYADIPVQADAIAGAQLVGEINDYSDALLEADAVTTATLSSEETHFVDFLVATATTGAELPVEQEFLIGEVIFIELVQADADGGASLVTDPWDPYIWPSEVVSVECYDTDVIVDISPSARTVDVAAPNAEVDL